jgi:hypothetical protein
VEALAAERCKVVAIRERFQDAPEPELATAH